MLKKISLLSFLVFLLSSCSGGVKDFKLDKKDQAESQSYFIGSNMGESIANNLPIELNDDSFLAGVYDGLKNKVQLNEEEKKKISVALQELIKSKQAELAEEKRQTNLNLAVENKVAEKEFFEKNKTAEGVKILKGTNIQYKVLEIGKGKKSPKTSDQVVVNYEGRNLKGEVFDSSYERGQPVTLSVNAVIKGWQEVLPKMKVGDKWQVFIPADLAYGEEGAGEVIGPNSALIFDIELKEIK